MAELLGGKAILESLRTDVSDIQWAINGILSRTGPVTVTSWKFPDKQSADLNVEELLDLYSYSEDAEDNQVAHIALYELVIDRFVFLLQTLSTLTQQMLVRAGEDITDQRTSSIGLVVKQFCNRQVQLNTVVQQTMSDIKTKSREMMDLENNMRKMSEELSKQSETSSQSTQPYHFSPHKVGSAMTGFVTPSQMENIARDACTKSCQTVETAFVPCEGCHVVQKNFRNAGDVIINMCQSQKLPSSLQKYRPLVSEVKWLSPNDVIRWATEQAKDLGRINKHMENLMATINPLKEELENCEQKCKKLERRVANFDAEMRKEREIQTTLQKQFDVKLTDIETEHKHTVSLVTKQMEEVKSNKESIEKQLTKYKADLESQQRLLTELEDTKKALVDELKVKHADSTEIERLQRHLDSVQSQLQEVEEKLERSAKELSKEQAKNKSAAKHNQSLQTKQSSLLQRIDDLDQENRELNNQVTELEEEKERIEETLEKVQKNVQHYKQKVKDNQALIDELSSQKEELEGSIETLKSDIQHLESKLEEAVEREKLMIEYPDLNGPVNPGMKGTGDIVTDMENQVKANTIRIQILEEQNETLRNSVGKVLGMQQGRSPPKIAWENTGPMHLWTDENLENAKQEDKNMKKNIWIPDSSYHENHNSNARPEHEERPRTKSSGKPRSSGSTYGNPVSDEFIVGRGSRPSSAVKKTERPASGKKMVTAPVNATSISAYIQLKRAGKLNMEDHPKSAVPPSGRERKKSPQEKHPQSADPHPRHNNHLYQKTEMFSCAQCDKMYSRARDLEIHKSYCTG
ncbi:coiled-coil domain-containing protein 157-like [Saccostrea echinata]|uniref:coiled-coil domain-containing protein 157-like n=1 Tax=Saccostrea echinata TaxID=191078 RepID=UPI002A838533|nr:coiled-coil domain-containing protein 157-like [Saccostrea echinata]